MPSPLPPSPVIADGGNAVLSYYSRMNNSSKSLSNRPAAPELRTSTIHKNPVLPIAKPVYVAKYRPMYFVNCDAVEQNNRF
mmetsp:Transcript_50929/g.59507  ORF Transcript_50929/g.59507 Transcript_50929/m.59507 type:complete len:81 (-) Transcript_50929:159-401(-)